MGYDFQKTYTLIPQTPLLHFQHNDAGATLRASEVKPKLDAFIIKKKGGIDKIPDSWFVKKDQSHALNYKIRLTAAEAVRKINVGRDTPYDIYYGNMGDNNQNNVLGIECKTELEITCFIEELLKCIKDNIAIFFIVTNFGRMSNKGFGSFIVENVTPRYYEEGFIAKCLKDTYSAAHCYSWNSGDKTKIFKQIKAVYSLMKSGNNLWKLDRDTGKYFQVKPAYSRSLLFEYMHEKHQIGNEKAWLKQNGIAPAIGTQHDQHDNKSGYVRALLGVGDKIEFLNDAQIRSKRDAERHNRANCRIKTTVSISNSQIERLASPILFKVINNKIYYVGRRINPIIYGKAFTFDSSMGNDICKVPEKEEVNKDKKEFIDHFLHYCYEKLNAGTLKKSRDTENLIIKEY